MNAAGISFYSMGFTVCLVIMAAAFAAAGWLFFRFGLSGKETRMFRAEKQAGRRTERRTEKQAGKLPGRDFKITEHVISVHTDTFIDRTFID